ncbi:MAG: aminotransferase class III-fold pyridoxal phosphate-dependent enzyme [Roseateles sp.]
MRSFQASEALLARAERVIPLGSQTFSKSRTQYPLGVSPFFIERGQGSRVWDVDGNEYLDLIMSLASVTLGYQDPDVTQAVARQLQDSGVIFSLPHRLEAEVAELIVDMVPCAEMVRFGKNGSDATAGAVRVARAYTGRERVIVCGYHGWQDWYIGSTARNGGVPKSTQELTHAIGYNDLAAAECVFAQFPGQIAAVILEPMNVTAPKPGYLEGMKALAHKHGALLVFDETITGFRYANGGAQELFGVTPDLATFGKGLANGFPVSAVAGRADVMKVMEDIFFSFTFGGELLSLAAAKATLEKLRRDHVLAGIAAKGERLQAGLNALLSEAGLNDLFHVSGHPSWTFLNIREARGVTPFEVKTLLMQEQHQRGVLCLGGHNLCHAHSDADIDDTLAMYREVLPMIGDVASRGVLREQLRCEPLVPLFKVR